MLLHNESVTLGCVVDNKEPVNSVDADSVEENLV